jgi:dihydrofolate reductase
MKISILVAASENGAIGKDNKLLWHLPDDLRHFKRLTSGHHILMGRKTYESIGKPLPNRTNLILTRSNDHFPEGCIRICSLDEGIYLAKNAGESELFIIGGGQVYEIALPYADIIYLTRVHCSIPGAHAFFRFAEKDWQMVSGEHHPKDEKHEYSFDILELKRK